MNRVAASRLPKRVFLTRGVGVGREKLTSFELALRDAGISHVNLIRVSSIFPPRARLVSREKGLPQLCAGGLTHCVLAENATNEPHRMISTSIGLALPGNPNQYGYLSEHHADGRTDEETGGYAEDLAAQMLATTLGIPFNPDSDYDERKRQYRSGQLIIRTTHIAQSAIGNRNGLWTTVLAAAVLL